MSDVTVRRMTLDDVDAVFEIEQESFARPWSRQAFVQEMTQNKCARYMVAEADGRVVAYAGAWIVLDEAHITNIAVRKACRGQGIGKKVTFALMQYAANLGVVYATLEVRRGNVVAQNLYKQAGFEYVGLRKKYYEDNGEDAFIFCCQHMPEPEEDFVEPETITEDTQEDGEE